MKQQQGIFLFGILTILSLLAGSFSNPAAAQTLPPVPSGLRLAEEQPQLVAELSGSKDLQRYIITLDQAPVALYRGEILGLAATNPEATNRTRLDAQAPAAQAYASYLQAQQSDFLSSARKLLNRDLKPTFQYLYAINGMAVELSAGEAAWLATMPGVARVSPDQSYLITTDVGPGLIGAPGIWEGTNTGGLPGTYGEGVLVGILDTGINMDHPSFADVGGDGYDHTNPFGSGSYVGWCKPGHGKYDPKLVCNDKLVGVWDFVDVLGYETDGPEDNNGHGSHTASTVAGNFTEYTYVSSMSVITATISGVAPHANIIAYDVCEDNTCPTSSVVAGIEQAILDGVDVLNESIGIGGDTFAGVKQQAYLGAVAAGIAASRSAGNSGPGASTISTEPVWTMSSAASTHSRLFALLMDVTGPIPVDPALEKMTAVIGSGPVFTTTLGANIRYHAGNLLGCSAFPADYFKDSLALVARGTCNFSVKVNNAFYAGAIGVVVYNNTGGPPTSMGGLEGTTIPSVMIDNPSGLAVKAWIDGHPGATAQMNPETSYLVNPAYQDLIAGFSSRGPVAADVLKPDIASPGVNILAASRTPEEFAFLQGTSMASPHTAGALALLKALRPAWTPSELRSALMTTASGTILKENALTPATPFDRGAGRTNLNAAARAGLVLDETVANFTNADPLTGGDPASLNIASFQASKCYQICTWTRTVKNPTRQAMNWSASYSGAGKASFSPGSFSIAAGTTTTFTFTLTVTELPQETWQFGEVIWTEAGSKAPAAHMPVAAYVSASTDSNALVKTANVSEAVEGDTVTYAIRLANTDVLTHTFHVTDVIPAHAAYVPGSATGGLVYDGVADQLTWSGPVAPSGFSVGPGASPYGYLPLSSFGVLPVDKPSDPDEGGFAFSVPAFSYFGQTYTSIIWSVNGTVEAGTASGLASGGANRSMPDPALPNNLLAPWWTDLDLTSGGNMYLAQLSDGANSYQVLEWKNVPRYGDLASTATFQVWIQQGTENIWFTYPNGAFTGSTADATVGAENANGSVGSMFTYNGTGTVPNNTSLAVVRKVAAPLVFTYQVEAAEAGVNVLNEVFASAGSPLDFAAWNNVKVAENPRLRLAHLAPFGDPGTVRVDIDGATAIPAFDYGGSTGYLEFTPGSHLIEVFPGGGSTAAITSTVNLAPGMDYTAVAVGDGVNRSLGLLLLADDNTPPAAGKFKLRLGHLAPFAASLAATTADVRTDGGTVILNDVQFGDVAAYIELTAGKYDLEITSPDGRTTVIDLYPVDLANGAILSVFATGEGANQPLGAFALPAGAPGSFLALETELLLPFIFRLFTP
jgi:uncharacterized repeat protein (TIGR01451 family)